MTGQAAVDLEVQAPRPVVSTIVLNAWLTALESMGTPKADVAADLGIEQALLESWDLFVDRSIELALVERAVELCGPEVGLRAARELPRGSFSLLEYMMRTAPDLGAALDHLLRYGALLGNPPAMVERDGTSYGIEFKQRVPGRDAESCVAEFALGCVAWIGRAATVEPWVPARVDFSHTPRFAEAAYRSHFRCAVRFQQPADALVPPIDALSMPMADADPRLHALLLRYSTEHGFGPYDTQTFAATVRRVLTETMRRGADLSLVGVSNALGVPARTCQDRLAREGTSYRRVLDNLREDLARKLLSGGELALPDIALLLGYSDPTAFHRAFKRWTGCTPASFVRGRRREG